MKRYIIILIATIFLYQPMVAQDKPVYWLHGFQFEPIPVSDQFPGRWDLYATKYQTEKKIQSFVPNYARTRAEVENGIVNSANVLSSRIANNSQSVIIAHSMGGLVARQLDANNLRTIGGIVTVGTAHNGALIATNLRNGRVLASAEKGATELIKGPGSTIFSFIFPFNIPGLNASKFANVLWDNILEGETMKLLPPTNSNTLRDLMPGSAVINNLNTRNTRVPFINVTIAEKDHEVLRLGSSAMDHPETQPLHTHDDGKLNSYRTKLESWYKALKDYYLTVRWTQIWLFNTLTERAGYYKDGEAYLDHGFEADYNKLNGGSAYESYTATRQVWFCDTDFGNQRSASKLALLPIGPLPAPGDCPLEGYGSDCSDCRWETETYTSYRLKRYHHDGLVTKKAQETSINQFTNFTATTVNHMEVGNHVEMTAIFKQIFDLPNVFNRKKR